MVRSAWALAFLVMAAGCERFSSLGRAADAAAGGDGGGDAAFALPVESVNIPVDGWVLRGELRPRGQGQLVVLVHQLGSNRHEWDSWIAQLTAHANGPSTLAIDLRGHGMSTEGPDGPTTWQSFGTEGAAWAGLVRDVEARIVWGVQHLTPRAARILVVGSGVGASAALMAAPEEMAVSGVLALSPVQGYHGLEVRDATRRFLAHRGAVLAVAAEGDAPGMEAVRVLRGEAPLGGGLRVLLVPGSGARGVAMHGHGFDLWAPLTSWLAHPEAVGVAGELRAGADGGVAAARAR